MPSFYELAILANSTFFFVAIVSKGKEFSIVELITFRNVLAQNLFLSTSFWVFSAKNISRQGAVKGRRKLTFSQL